jgi:hypothetical protein
MRKAGLSELGSVISMAAFEHLRRRSAIPALPGTRSPALVQGSSISEVSPVRSRRRGFLAPPLGAQLAVAFRRPVKATRNP